MIIYQIRNTVNGKVYIGQSINGQRRWMEHLSRLKMNVHQNHYLQRAYHVYGELAFVFEVLEEVTDSKILTEKEQYWVNLKNSSNPNCGYNLTECVNAPWKGKHLSKEHRRKLSLAHIGKCRPHSEETKIKIGLSNKGNNKCGWSKGLNKETDSRIKSPWNKGKTGVYSEEHRKYLSSVLKGKNKGKNRHSPEFLKILSERWMGAGNPRYAGAR